MDKFTRRKNKIALLSIILILIILTFFIHFVISRNENVLLGLYKIITSQTNLITDFLLVGGIGATFLNAFLIFFFNLFLVKILKIEITGIVIALFLTIFGFSFFGKNILNIIPFYLGGILYSTYSHTEFKDNYISVAFSSALAPFVSEVAFQVKTYDTSFINAIILGTLIGFVVVPISVKMFTFHEGFNLYNLGFTAGIIGTVVTSILKLYGFKIESHNLISTEFDFALNLICTLFFIALIVIGFYINGRSMDGFKELINDDGLSADFVLKYGYGVTFMNMGIMGFVSLIFLILIDAPLNGPLLAGVLTVVGFAAYGKTILNTIPILIGVYLATVGNSIGTFTIALSGLFGTALAPISGVYGMYWGIFAGWLHLAVVQTIGTVHEGLNLYNNGFSAGIVASIILPLARMIREKKSQDHVKFIIKQKDILNELNKRIEKIKSERNGENNEDS